MYARQCHLRIDWDQSAAAPSCEMVASFEAAPFGEDESTKFSNGLSNKGSLAETSTKAAHWNPLKPISNATHSIKSKKI